MDFHVRCECGHDVAVSASTAGTTCSCSCGRTVRVPSLSELKRQAGLPAYSPPAVLVIEHMLAEGKLPCTATCAGCDDTTGEVIDAIAECEKVRTSEPNDDLTFFAIAFVFFGFFWTFLLSFLRRQQDTREFGRTLTLRLPIRLCSNCQRKVFRKPRLNFRVLGTGLAVLGLALMVFWTAWGGLLLAGSVLVWWQGSITGARQQAAIKNVLQRVPVYENLLRDYPHAKVR